MSAFKDQGGGSQPRTVDSGQVQGIQDGNREIADFVNGVDLSEDVEVGGEPDQVVVVASKSEVKQVSQVSRPQNSPFCYGTGENIPEPSPLCGSCTWRQSCFHAIPVEVMVKRSVDYIERDSKLSQPVNLTRKAIMEAYRDVHFQMYGRLPHNPIGCTASIIHHVKRLKCELRTYFFLSLVSYRDYHFFDDPVWDSWFGCRAETNGLNAYVRVLKHEYACVDDVQLAVHLGLQKDQQGRCDWSQYRTPHDLPWQAWKEHFPDYRATEADLKAALSGTQSDMLKGEYAARFIRAQGSSGRLPHGLRFSDLFGDYAETLVNMRRLRDEVPN